MTKKQQNSITAGFAPVLMAITIANAFGQPTTTVAAPDPAPVELTSPELVKLKAELIEKRKAQASANPEDETAWNAAATETLEVQHAITKEKARLVKEANDQKLAELRKGVIADFDGFLSLRDKAAAKTATDDDKTAATNAYELIINKLLGTVPKPKVDGAAGAAKSGTKSEQIVAMAEANNTYDQMIAAGMGDGTIRTALTKSTGWKKNTDGTYSKI